MRKLFYLCLSDPPFLLKFLSFLRHRRCPRTRFSQVSYSGLNPRSKGGQLDISFLFPGKRVEGPSKVTVYVFFLFWGFRDFGGEMVRVTVDLFSPGFRQNSPPRWREIDLSYVPRTSGRLGFRLAPSVGESLS